MKKTVSVGMYFQQGHGNSLFPIIFLVENNCYGMGKLWLAAGAFTKMAVEYRYFKI